MKLLIILCALISTHAHARFLFQYGLNYSSEKDGTSGATYDKSRVFHKVFLGASVNDKRTLFFGWNINSWTSQLKTSSSTNVDKYSMLEMGPKIIWYLSDNYNWYFDAEWNPYAKGSRNKAGTQRTITSGTDTGFGIGYRFKVSRLFGLGASLHYQTVSVKEEKQGTTASTVSDGVTHLMPMLELSMLTK